MAKQRYDVIELDEQGQEVIARQVWRDTPPDKTNCRTLPNGRLSVRPRIEERAEIDPATHALEPQPPVIGESRVVYAWTARELTAEEKLVIVRQQRAEAYRERLGKLPGNSQIETIGDVLDAVIKALAGDSTELQAIAAEAAKIKAEIPKPD